MTNNIPRELMYWNFVAIDGIIKNQINTQQDATLKGKTLDQPVQCSWTLLIVLNETESLQWLYRAASEDKTTALPLDQSV
jgi:hypothetical protein